MRYFALPSLVLVLFLGRVSAQIYADFETSLGNFTCELNYTAAPKTVANFVGLAEGSRPWIDPLSGNLQVGVPFYNGVTFHRVIADFMSQSGSKNGDGTDGPGYSFVDETSNGLIFDQRHVIAMANSGKNTNGSQFFITDVPRTQLNGIHTVFGKVTSGGTVVDAINNVATNLATEKPLVPVLIQSIAIRRVGSAAQSFNINSKGLPEISSIRGELEVTVGQKVDLRLPSAQLAGTVISTFRSANLNQWSAGASVYREPGPEGNAKITIDEEDPITEEIEVLPSAFYKRHLVSYSDAIAPDRVKDRTLNFTNGANTFSFDFSANGQGGTFSSNLLPNPVAITKVSSSFGPYRTILIVEVAGYRPFRFSGSTAVANATQFTGSETFEQHNGVYWQSFGAGMFTLTK